MPCSCTDLSVRGTDAALLFNALQLHQKLALRTVQAMRSGFDLATGYKHGKVMDEGHWLRRIIFLETVAGMYVVSRYFSKYKKRQHLACEASKQRHPTPACKAGHARRARLSPPTVTLRC
jgi:hypothetical protein